MNSKSTELSTMVVGSVLALLVSGCGEPRIRGAVQDPFGDGIEGVSVKIDTSAYEAVTDADGAYAIDYAPGTLRLRFTKENYTTRILDINLSQKEDFPAEEILMYPIPLEAGIFYIGEDRLIPLVSASVRRADQQGTWSSTFKYYAAQDGEIAVGKGEAIFIDTDPGDQKLCKLGPNRLIYDVTYQMMLGSPTFECFRADSSEQVGEEQLWIRRATLEEGSWAWVDIGQGPVWGSSGPGQRCFSFVVPQAEDSSGGAMAGTIEGNTKSADASEVTMETMKEVGTAMFAWLVDQWGEGTVSSESSSGSAASANSFSLERREPITPSELEKLLVPDYLGALPISDGWGNRLQFYVSRENLGSQHSLVIRSPGSDGAFQSKTYVQGSFPLERGEEDIVWTDGFFIRYPERL